MRRELGYLAASAASVALLAAVSLEHRHQLAATLGRVSPALFALAVLLHLATLFARAEAWRLTLLAIERRRVPARSIRLATAAGFLAGIAETHLAMPARVAVLRRLAPRAAPRVPQMLLTDVPMMALEGCCSAVLLVAAASALPAMPWWMLPLIVTGTAGGLLAIRLAHERMGHHPLVAGVAILGAPGLRERLAGLAATTVALTLARVGILLAGCRLAPDPAHVVLVYLAVSVLGLLPIGPASNAAATLAAAGAPSVGAAAAAGVAIAATSIAAVVIYAAMAAAGYGARLAMRRRAPLRAPAARASAGAEAPRSRARRPRSAPARFAWRSRARS